MSRILALSLAVHCAGPAVPEPAEPRELTHLRAFARLYGVLRFFHPSDEAAAFDWNRYAVLGAGRVTAARPGELEATLEQLVAPIAPTVQILGPGEAVADAHAPTSTEGLVQVAWQHRGPGFDVGRDPYLSKRTGREAASAAQGSGWASVSQSIDAEPHRGKPFRLRAFVKAGVGGKVGAWARVDLDGGAHGFFDNMM
jgi:hypothetical protein